MIETALFAVIAVGLVTVALQAPVPLPVRLLGAAAIAGVIV